MQRVAYRDTVAFLVSLFVQGALTTGIVVAIYAGFRAWRPGDYSSLGATLAIAALALLAVINPLLGIAVKPWGRWIVYAIVSSVGGFLMMALSGWLYDAFRPAGLEPSGSAGIAFLLPAFPYILAGVIALIVRWLMYRQA